MLDLLVGDHAAGGDLIIAFGERCLLLGGQGLVALAARGEPVLEALSARGDEAEEFLGFLLVEILDWGTSILLRSRAFNANAARRAVWTGLYRQVGRTT